MNRRLKLWLCAGVVAVGAIQVSVAFSRSLIPYRLDGTLEKIGWVGDTNGRLRTLNLDGREYVIDNQRLVETRIGRVITKDPWSATLLLDDRKEVRLTVGDETFQFAALTLLAVTGVMVLGGRQADGTVSESAVGGVDQ